MPITATLAMVASASMAGVPLLNGFLSKEMFFAETVFIQATRLVRMWPARRRHRGRHVQRGLFAALHARRVLRPARHRPAPARRTNRRTGCACRSSCWCWPAWWWASSRPGRSARCWPPRRARGGRRTARVQPGGLARLQPPLVMSLVAHGRRRRCCTCCCAAQRALRPHRRTAADAPLRRQAPLRSAAGAAERWPGAWAGACSARSACSRRCCCWCAPRCWPARCRCGPAACRSATAPNCCRCRRCSS